MKNQVNIKHYKRAEIPDGFELRNDRIKDVSLHLVLGFIIGLELEYESGAQPVGLGYHNTSNVGWQAVTLLNTLADADECADIRRALIGTPIRVAYKGEPGAYVAECTYIGHFMRDDFLYYKDIVTLDPPRGNLLTERDAALLTELDRLGTGKMRKLEAVDFAVLRDAAAAMRRLGGAD